MKGTDKPELGTRYIYCAFKINLQCRPTQTSFRGEIFHDFPEILVKITENRGHFGENDASRVVVCVVSLQINFENTILFTCFRSFGQLLDFRLY